MALEIKKSTSTLSAQLYERISNEKGTDSKTMFTLILSKHHFAQDNRVMCGRLRAMVYSMLKS